MKYRKVGGYLEHRVSKNLRIRAYWDGTGWRPEGKHSAQKEFIPMHRNRKEIHSWREGEVGGGGNSLIEPILLRRVISKASN